MRRLAYSSIVLLALHLNAGAATPHAPAPLQPVVHAFELPQGKWTKIAEMPPDPLGRELEPGRGAFMCYEPASEVFLRYGGYTPTEGNDLWTFDLVARRWENPLKVDYTWPPPVARPGAGAWWSMAYDAKRKVVWLCGGEGVAARKQPALFDDIWQYDPAKKTFMAMKSKGFPNYSRGCRIAYDSKNDVIVRAPAYDSEWASQHNRDTTWVYDPNKNAWEGRSTPSSPKHALAAALVFNPAVGKVVYLASGKDHLIDTWTFDAYSNAWTKIDTQVRPAARVVAGAAYCADDQRVFVCGGVGGGKSDYGYLFRGGGVQLADTWALDVSGAKWEKLEVGAPVVPKLNGETGNRFEIFTAMDYDSKNKTFVLSAPTLGVWALSLRDPSNGKPAAPLRLAALPPPQKAEPAKESANRQAPANKRLLDLPVHTWTQLEGGPSIGGGEVPMIFDETTGYCLKYGGCNNAGAGTFSSGYGNDLSAYDPATERWIALRWVDPCGPPRPENGCTRAYCHDPVRMVNWFAGGTSGNQLATSLPAGFTGSLHNATWCYSGPKDRFELVPTQGRTPHAWDRVVCCYDRSTQQFIFNSAHLFNPATRTWSEGPTGMPVMFYSYSCYVESLKAMLVVKQEKVSDTEWTYHTLVYSAPDRAWKPLGVRGSLPSSKDKGRPSTAYDPGNNAVLCVMQTQTYILELKANEWKALAAQAPEGIEVITFDIRHKVFLATGAMGKHMWAFRTGP